MEERVGAYIIDSDGVAVPDMNDEAMAARQLAVRDEGRETRDVHRPSSIVSQKEMEVKDA